MLRKLLRLQPQPAIVYLHYWAGKRLKHEFAETVEDTYNLILKVPPRIFKVQSTLVKSTTP